MPKEQVPPRRLNANDIFDFMQAATGKAPPKKTREYLIIYLNSKSRRRYRRLKKDFLWTQKLLQELGLDPEIARYLL